MVVRTKLGPVKTMNRAALVTPRCSVHNKRGKKKKLLERHCFPPKQIKYETTEI